MDSGSRHSSAAGSAAFTYNSTPPKSIHSEALIHHELKRGEAAAYERNIERKSSFKFTP